MTRISLDRVDKLMRQFSEEEERKKELEKEEKIKDEEAKKKQEMSEDEKDKAKEEKKEKDFSERFSRKFAEETKGINERMVALEEGFAKVLDMCEKKFSKK